MYVLSVYGPTQRVGELNIDVEFGGDMKEFAWSWTGLGLTSSGNAGWAESEESTGYFIMLEDDAGQFAHVKSKLWENAKRNTYRGHPPLPWFPRKIDFKGTMILFAVFDLPPLDWYLV
jgi:hypothetical protein